MSELKRILNEIATNHNLNYDFGGDCMSGDELYALALEYTSPPQSYKIYHWHGKGPNHKDLDFEGISKHEDGDEFFTGTLDEFKDRYGQKFIYIPREDDVDLIAITPYSSFGAR